MCRWCYFSFIISGKKKLRSISSPKSFFKVSENLLPTLHKDRVNELDLDSSDLSVFEEARKGYFRHHSKLFYICVGVGQTPIFCHFWICWTSFPIKLKPLKFEVADDEPDRRQILYFCNLEAHHAQIFRKCYFWYLFHITTKLISWKSTLRLSCK